MRFLVDECMYVQIVEHIRRAGHDVWWVREGLSSSEDMDLLALAVAERRILVSEDRDFGELVFRDRQPALGVILVKVSEFDLDPEAMGALVAEAIGSLVIATGKFFVIEPGRVGIRDLPEER